MRLLSAILGIHLLVLAQGAAAPQEETGDDKLRQELQQRYRGVLRQADLDRQNDPNLYMQRLTAVEVQLLNRTKSHGGLRNGIGSMSADTYYVVVRPPEPRGVLFQPEAVPFLLDILINGPPSQGKGLAKAAHPEREYWHSWKPGEYELWARCLAAWIVGRYKHPDVLPILGEHRKRASQPELRRSSCAGLVAARDPNAIDLLIEALSDSDSEIREGAWLSVNFLTGRGRPSWTAEPSPEHIAVFKRWWQENREAVIAKIYNPETGRLEPKYTLPPEERWERHLPSKPVPEGTLLLAMSVRGDSPGLSSDYDGEWLVQYCDPNGAITELMQECAVVLPDFLLAVHPLRQLGGELLVSFEADGHFVPWAYVRHASTHPVKLTQEADFVIEQDKQVPVTLTCRRTSELENYLSIGLYYAEDSRLPLYQVDLGSGPQGAGSSWSATLEIMPGTYHIQGKLKGDGQNQSLGQIRVQAQDEAQMFDLPSSESEIGGHHTELVDRAIA